MIDRLPPPISLCGFLCWEVSFDRVRGVAFLPTCLIRDNGPGNPDPNPHNGLLLTFSLLSERSADTWWRFGLKLKKNVLAGCM